MLRYAARRVPAAEVDDVVAETFVVACRRLDAVPDPALPWLLGVARGVAAHAVRAANRRASLERRLAVVPPPVAQRPLVAEAVLQALARLSPSDRELLTLIAWDGLTPAEAAAALGCARGTLSVRLHRARSRLRRELAALGTPTVEPDHLWEEARDVNLYEPQPGLSIYFGGDPDTGGRAHPRRDGPGRLGEGRQEPGRRSRDDPRRPEPPTQSSPRSWPCVRVT